MPGKNKLNIKLNNLPTDVAKHEIGKYLSEKDKSALSLTSKKTQSMFQPHRLQDMAYKLLLQVMHGEQDTAEIILNIRPELLKMTAKATDYSGRTFNCTAYEYAYWAKDTHMRRMLEAKMDKNTKAEMLTRINAIQANGLTYAQFGQQIAGSKGFNLEPLKTAYNEFIQTCDPLIHTDEESINASLMRVGLAQRDLPVHYVNEYVRDDRQFYPTPTFDEWSLPRDLTFINCVNSNHHAFFPLEASGPGVDFTLMRGETGEDEDYYHATARRYSRPQSGFDFANYGYFAKIDLKSVSRLDEVRTNDLTESHENLEIASHEPGLLMANKLLLHVMRGEQNKAEILLNMHPVLLRKPGRDTDYSGRTFNCTAYEYAYWAKDTHMRRMLESHMDSDIKAEMLTRINAIQANGLTYTQFGQQITGSKSFNLDPLKTACNEYIRAAHACWDLSDDSNDDDSSDDDPIVDEETVVTSFKKIGLAQRDLPVHYVNEYFRKDREFEPVPAFNEQDLPREISFLNGKTDQFEHFFPLAGSGSLSFGDIFTFVRGATRAFLGATVGMFDAKNEYFQTPRLVQDDLASVSHLDEVRTEELMMSHQNLEQTSLVPGVQI